MGNMLINNTGLQVGDIVSEERSEREVYQFEITAVLGKEYLCEYISDKPIHNRTFYWQKSDRLDKGGVNYYV